MAWNSGLKIYLFYGKKGSGKSLYQSFIAQKLIKSYYKNEKRYPQLSHRKYYSSMKFSDSFEKQELGKHLEYWTNPKQLYEIKDADIGWDEIGKDLPAGSWETTPKELKQVFSHLRKRGNRIFANTQIYEDIDISFRRQIDKAYKITKLFGSRDISASLPNPKHIYGFLKVTEFDPMELEHERDETRRFSLGGFPKIIRITRKLVNLYDTKMEIPAYMPDTFSHKEIHCPDCGDTKVIHRPI